MLYLDYSRPEGGWIPNKYGGRENLEAIDFLRRFNREVFGEFPHGDHRRGRIRPRGRRCRGRSNSAGSASATSGTWGGCTTR